ncbi:aldehyde dehydrogenase family protein, partial [Pseudocolwellia agarivorans]|uniref:aldehyde dehydrogenase family protein n=1 Tax=Pseudocolwellia agarivorans TaxID=1911682 RepID=UPI001FEADA26
SMLNFNMTINGQSVTSSNLLSVINPATEEVFATCAIADKATVDSAVEAARKAFKSWSSMPDTERAAKVASIAGILEQNMPELMELVTKESGKPLGGLNGVGSGMEVGGSIAWTQATASFPLPVDIIQDDEVATVEVHRKALGVVASITPWNWPLMIAIWHVIPALRSGNTVVIKPASSTPVATLRFVELVQQVLPPGVLNIVIGGREVGHALASHQDINKVVFTGSTNVGKGIMREASSNLKRLTLELGGNDAG